MADEPLTCQELVELVTYYLHQMQTTLELVGVTADFDTGPEVSALLDAFREWRRSGA